MNILMNCLPVVSGGGVAIIRNLAPLLSRRFEDSTARHKITFLAHESQEELFAGIPDYQLVWIAGDRRTGWRRLKWEREHIKRTARQSNADILFTPYQIGPRIKGTRQVLMLTNMEPFLFDQYVYDAKTRLRNYALRIASSRSLRRADRVIAISVFTQDHLVRKLGIPVNRVRMVYHGRDEALGLATVEEAEQQRFASYGVAVPFILTCGSLLPYRRCEDVIAAFDRSAESLPEGTQLVIAGSGTDDRYGDLIKRAIDASPYRERILAVGHVPRDVMRALYRQCDACVIATEIEACPNIAIEAMTAGCAIIANDKPPLPEIFDNAYQRYRARDISHLAEVMEQVVTDEGLRGTLKMRSLKRAEHFSWATCADETYAALTDWS